MTNQIQGEILFKGIDPASGFVYSPWITVRGDKATYGIEVLQINGVTVTWRVDTRSDEDPSVVTQVVGDRTVTTAIVDVASSTAAKQMVRYGVATGSGADATKWAVLRLLSPSWQADR